MTLPDGVADAAIREGRCGDVGAVAFELPEGETTVPIDLVELLGGRYALVAGETCAEIIAPGG